MDSDSVIKRIQTDFADDLADRKGDFYEQIKDLVEHCRNITLTIEQLRHDLSEKAQLEARVQELEDYNNQLDRMEQLAIERGKGMTDLERHLAAAQERLRWLEEGKLILTSYSTVTCRPSYEDTKRIDDWLAREPEVK